MIGVEVANEISSAVEKLGAIDSLIIDLRGNTGGGIGALRVMSMITPGRVRLDLRSTGAVSQLISNQRSTVSIDSHKSRLQPRPCGGLPCSLDQR